MSNYRAHLRKMKHQINSDNSIDYQLRMIEGKDETLEPINQYIGKKVKIEFQDQINCVACGRKTNKSFGQGYCFPCLQNLAECDTCIIKPELCHFDEGTCRDNDFAQSHCNINHSIYLALTSGIKIGVTRQMQEKTRWVDQGAVQALRVMTLRRRYHAGLIEAELAKEMQDKTNWQKMLKNNIDHRDLEVEKINVLARVRSFIEADIFDEDLSYILEEAEVLSEKTEIQRIEYPVISYPDKVKSFNLDKDPVVEGTLIGIKGQYWIMDTGVINLRKYGGYLVSVDLG
ncbi:MAG: DUF2797 domain-containing protein [Cyanobacteria bacterium]|nr:DUF2797 domain-containing protein [Cyanobacteriota bacterium]MDA1020630.1 DUF2797 domain-containing protein [Cyanobacteriota bacterium]